MDKLLRWLNAICAALDKAAWAASLLILAVMSVLVIKEIISRYIFGYTTVWVDEATRYLMIWMTMIVSSSGIRRSQLISLDLVIDRLPATLSRVVFSVGCCFVLAFLCIVVYYGIHLVQVSFVQTSPGLRIPMAWAYLAIPLGGVLMIIQTIGALFLPRQKPVVVGEGVE